MSQTKKMEKKIKERQNRLRNQIEESTPSLECHK